VKIEGGVEVAGTVAAIVSMGVPVMGHVGLTPQSVHAFGGYRVQGKDPRRAKEILEGARALEEAGAFAVVLEGVPASLAREVTAALSVPTIGIGAGPDCDGQVLVLHDLLGIYREFTPKFVKRYADLGAEAEKAVREFCSEVRGGKFPDEEYSFN
jgi:3-methyl-2-oxobutanoate hydroxymethyltransferase